jgi:hypothetical protein
MMKVAFSADVTGLATAIAGLHDGFESPSAVDIHWNTRGKYMQRGMHCCRDCGDTAHIMFISGVTPKSGFGYVT